MNTMNTESACAEMNIIEEIVIMRIVLPEHTPVNAASAQRNSVIVIIPTHIRRI